MAGKRPNYSPDEPTPLWISRDARALLLEAYEFAKKANRTVAIQVISSDIERACDKRRGKHWDEDDAEIIKAAKDLGIDL